MINSIITNKNLANNTSFTFSENVTYNQILDANNHTYSMKSTVSNTIGTRIINSTDVIKSREYNPNLFTSVQGNYLVNYTLSRTNAFTHLNLKVNREPINFQIECNYKTMWDAINREPGTWINKTNVGFFNSTKIVNSADTIYFSCYNDHLLFAFHSYGNSTENPLKAGIALFDNFGGLLGAPAIMLVVIAIFSLATGKNTPQILILSMIVVGILGAIGLIVLTDAYWGLLFVATGIGIFAMKRYYF